MILKSILINLCLLLGSFELYTQYENLLHQTYAQRRDKLGKFYTDELPGSDRNQAQLQNKVNAIKATAEKNNDQDLELECGLMQIHINDAFHLSTKKQILKELDSLYAIAEANNVNWLKCRILSFSALMCFGDAYNYELAFNYAELLNAALPTVTKEDFPEKQVCYNQIAHFYYFFHEWNNALHYCEPALRETRVGHPDQYQMQICNLIGLIHEKNLRYDSAIAYYHKALQSINPNDPTLYVWGGILKGNIGNCLYYKKQYAESKPLLFAAVDSGIKHHNGGVGFVSDAYKTLGMIALDENNIQDAQKFLTSSRWYANQPQEYFRLEKLYPLLARLAKKQNNYSLMSLYLDSAITVKDSMANKMNALYVLRGTQKAALLKEQKLEADQQVKTTQRNFLIAFIIIATLVAMYIFYTQRKRFQQKRAIDQLRLQKNEHELQLATEQLNAFALTISEKNRLLEDLESKLGTSPNMETLTELKESTILTEEQWERFRKLFDQVHRGYILRLKDKLPDLTQAEIRFMVLAKLKFSNKEMAGALNVSSQAIRTTWYRLRKKLNLPEEGSLEELVDTI